MRNMKNRICGRCKRVRGNDRHTKHHCVPYNNHEIRMKREAIKKHVDNLELARRAK